MKKKNSIQQHYQQLKQRIKVYRSSQNQRLLHLSQSANLCKKVLKEKTDQARRVIQLAELSRRMETLQEQILPFARSELEEAEDMQRKVAKNQDGTDGDSVGGTSMPQSQQPTGNRAHNNAQRGTTAATEHGSTAGTTVIGLSEVPPPPHQSSVMGPDLNTPILPMDRLANFYRKYNKLLLDNLAINKEKERLNLENAQLQDLIQQYVEGTQVSDSILAGDNPLFVVNGRANLNFDPPVRQLRPVVQDAVQIQSTNARQHAW